MGAKIRLRRMGTKKKAYFRFVVADSRSPRDGRFIETVGTYNPLVKPAEVVLKEDRIYDWLEKGAIPTETVQSLFRQVGLAKKWGMMKKKGDTSTIQLKATIQERTKKKKTKKSEAPAKKEKESKPEKVEAKKEEEKQPKESKKE